MASKYSMGYGDLELQKMMQTELQGYYKKLADIKMENPKKAASNMHLDGIQLDKLIDLHNVIKPVLSFNILILEGRSLALGK